MRRAADLTGLVIVGVLCGLLVGCSSTSGERGRLNSRYPLDRARAIVRLAEAGDTNAVHKLVDLLEDSDRAVRLYAILALERLCQTNYGYNYYDPEPERERAVRRWRDALRNGDVVARAGTGLSPPVDGSDEAGP